MAIKSVADRFRRPFNSLRYKLSFITVSITLVVLFFAISISYIWGYRLLSSVILSNSKTITEILSFSLSQDLIEKTKDFQAYARDVRVLQAVQAGNAFISAMSPAVREQYVLDMDRQWLAASPDSGLVQGYMSKDASVYLRYFTRGDEVLGEMILTDQFGCLVAATGKTTDFYQADEKWWLDAYNGGVGRIVIGDAEFDDSSGIWIIPVSVPVVGDRDQVIGILKASISVERYFAYLSRLHFGASGHALIINEKGNVIVHEKVKPMQYQVFSGSVFFKDINTQKTITLEDSPIHGNGYFVVCSPVSLGQSLVQDFHWYVCVEVKKGQIFAPLDRFLMGMLVLALILITVAVMLGIQSGRKFAEPVQKLKQAAERIARGEFDTDIHIDTHDEIEALTDTFTAMAADLRRFTKELNLRNEALELSNVTYQEMVEKLNIANHELVVLKTEMEDKVNHLEQFSKISIGRELRMRQLKEKIAALEEECARLKGASS
ncbi:MAG TPA: cache domain-containing protein [Candidatus Omnitrophota bacterium]|nr:cache domain-containing protein [Candidatus Omnitrophota bacterium]